MPCLTINRAVAQLQPGDALFVRPGVYDECPGGEHGENQFPSDVVFAAAERGIVTVQGIWLGTASRVVVDGFVADG